MDGDLRRSAFVRFEPIDDPEASVAGVASPIAVAVEVEMTTVDDVSAPGACAVLGSSPRVVTKPCQRLDRRTLDGEEHRVVLQLGELSGQRLPMTRTKVLAQPKQVVARGVR